MADYKSMYTKLFNAATDAINILQRAQIVTEGVYIAQEEQLSVLKAPDNKDTE